jgi:hypothetical protein
VFKINNAGATMNYLEATAVVFTRSLAWPSTGNSLRGAGGCLMLSAVRSNAYLLHGYKVQYMRGIPKAWKEIHGGLHWLKTAARTLSRVLITIPTRRHHVSRVVCFTNMMLSSPYLSSFRDPIKEDTGNMVISKSRVSRRT